MTNEIHMRDAMFLRSLIALLEDEVTDSDLKYEIDCLFERHDRKPIFKQLLSKHATITIHLEVDYYSNDPDGDDFNDVVDNLNFEALEASVCDDAMGLISYLEDVSISFDTGIVR